MLGSFEIVQPVTSTPKLVPVRLTPGVRRIVFDVSRMRPACVLLQVAMGGDPWIANRFDSRTWLVAPTPEMKLYAVTDAQLAQLVERVERSVKER